MPDWEGVEAACFYGSQDTTSCGRNARDRDSYVREASPSVAQLGRSPLLPQRPQSSAPFRCGGLGGDDSAKAEVATCPVSNKSGLPYQKSPTVSLF